MPIITLHQHYGIRLDWPLSHRASLVPVGTRITRNGRRLVYVRIPETVTLTKADKNLVWWALRRRLHQSPVPPRAIHTPHCLIYEQTQ